MLDSLPPAQLGATLTQAAQTAIAVVTTFALTIILLLTAWAIITNCFSRVKLVPLVSAMPDSASGSASDSPFADTTMMPLEVDLTRVETLPILLSLPSQPSLPTPQPSAFPLYTPPSTTSGSSGSSVAVLDGRAGASNVGDAGDDQWPPEPMVAGATIYPYIFASGMLVRLRGLRRFEAAPTESQWWALN